MDLIGPNEVQLQLSGLTFVLSADAKGIGFIELDYWNHKNEYIRALLLLCWRKYTNEIVRLLSKTWNLSIHTCFNYFDGFFQNVLRVFLSFKK